MGWSDWNIWAKVGVIGGSVLGVGAIAAGIAVPLVMMNSSEESGPTKEQPPEDLHPFSAFAFDTTNWSLPPDLTNPEPPENYESEYHINAHGNE